MNHGRFCECAECQERRSKAGEQSPARPEHHRKLMLEVTGPRAILGWAGNSQLLVPAGVERICVVAVKGGVDDWAAYVGPEGWIAERVQTHGEKLPVDVAANVFPILKPERYRR